MPNNISACFLHAMIWMALPVPHIACGVIENCSLWERVKELKEVLSCRCLALGWLLAALLLLLGYRYGSPQPVDGGGGDAPRVARPFSDRIDAFYVALPHLVA